MQQYERLAEPFGAVVETIDDWEAASPCEGWSARDVLAHVVDTQRDFLGAHVDVGAAPELGDDSGAGWRSHDARVRELLGDPAVAATEFEGHFGPATVGDTLVRFYGFDLLVHRWDLARSAGRDERFNGNELGIIEAAVEGFGDALYGDGICKRPVPVPEGADRQARTLALLGRAASPVA
nr:TIGR03086 family metal-binding protein [Kineosphaera limosa]